ncbi:MAG: 4Fe-4S dicluster domain-containing protein [Spirochaetota bacterium]|nr:4Fe-4S dicluster domain-containing protein [Spirochaetota bacterium]
MKGIFVDIERCTGCKSCEIYCAVQHSESKQIFSAVFEDPLPSERIKVETFEESPIPIQCRHCDESPCVDACPSGALSSDAETGIVSLEEERCIGCWMCAMVCPFGAIIPRRDSKLILKCDRCPDLDQPACVNACPTNALVFGELDEVMKKYRKKAAQITISAIKKEISIGGLA